MGSGMRMDPLSRQWPRYVTLAPSILIAGGIIWNAVTPAEYWGDWMLSAAVVVAGAMLSLTHTIAAGVAIILAEVGLTMKDGTFGHEAGTLELANTLFIAAVGLGVNRVVAHHWRRLQVVRSVAEAAQRAVLPAPPRRLGPLAVAACYRAAQNEARIGGDAYAVQDTPHGPRLLIADVRGKGLGAVTVVSVLFGAFREAAELAPDLTSLAERLEHAVLREAARREEEVRLEGFVTALLGEIAPDGSFLRLLNCGHPAPYLFHDGTMCALGSDDPGLPLGMSVLGVPRPDPDGWPFRVGDTLLLVTDGVTEARDRSGDFYDPLARLSGLGPFRQPGEVIDVLVRDVECWTGGPRDDDMAVLAITREGDGPGAP
jgi:serine phosphatase RsbU (regulator of sigma subunit)